MFAQVLFGPEDTSIARAFVDGADVDLRGDAELVFLLEMFDHEFVLGEEGTG
jgi:hypothetical protein